MMSGVFVWTFITELCSSLLDQIRQSFGSSDIIIRSIIMTFSDNSCPVAFKYTHRKFLFLKKLLILPVALFLQILFGDKAKGGRVYAIT